MEVLSHAFVIERAHRTPPHSPPSGLLQDPCLQRSSIFKTKSLSCVLREIKDHSNLMAIISPYTPTSRLKSNVSAYPLQRSKSVYTLKAYHMQGSSLLSWRSSIKVQLTSAPVQRRPWPGWMLALGNNPDNAAIDAAFWRPFNFSCPAHSTLSNSDFILLWSALKPLLLWISCGTHFSYPSLLGAIYCTCCGTGRYLSRFYYLISLTFALVLPYMTVSVCALSYRWIPYPTVWKSTPLPGAFLGPLPPPYQLVARPQVFMLPLITVRLFFFLFREAKLIIFGMVEQGRGWEFSCFFLWAVLTFWSLRMTGL